PCPTAGSRRLINQFFSGRESVSPCAYNGGNVTSDAGASTSSSAVSTTSSFSLPSTSTLNSGSSLSSSGGSGPGSAYGCSGIFGGGSSACRLLPQPPLQLNNGNARCAYLPALLAIS